MSQHPMNRLRSCIVIAVLGPATALAAIVLGVIATTSVHHRMTASEWQRMGSTVSRFASPGLLLFLVIWMCISFAGGVLATRAAVAAKRGRKAAGYIAAGAILAIIPGPIAWFVFRNDLIALGLVGSSIALTLWIGASIQRRSSVAQLAGVFR